VTRTIIAPVVLAAAFDAIPASELAFVDADTGAGNRYLSNGQQLLFARNTNAVEEQTVTITGGPAGGTFTLTLSGQTTAAIDFDATADELKLALEALSNIAVGDIEVTGGPGPATPWVVKFVNITNPAQMTADGALLTGGVGPAVAVTTTVAGGAAATITITSANDPYGRTKDLTALSLKPGEVWCSARLPLSGWRQSDGYVYVDGSSTSIEFAVLDLSTQVSITA
jgi:hypothetical protein